MAYCWVIAHMKRFDQQSGHAVHWQPSVDIAERFLRLFRPAPAGCWGLLFFTISIHLSQVLSEHEILVAKMRLLQLVFRYSRKALCDIYVSLHNSIIIYCCFFWANYWECSWLVLYYYVWIALLYCIVKWQFMWEILKCSSSNMNLLGVIHLKSRIFTFKTSSLYLQEISLNPETR